MRWFVALGAALAGACVAAPLSAVVYGAAYGSSPPCPVDGGFLGTRTCGGQDPPFMPFLVAAALLGALAALLVLRRVVRELNS